MALDVPIKIYGVVALIMFFTYFAVGITSADEYINPMDSARYGENTTVYMGSFESWLDLQFGYAYNLLVNYESEVFEEPFYDELTFYDIQYDYQGSAYDESDIFEQFGHSSGSGIAWFTSPYVQEASDIWYWLFGGSEAGNIKARYDEAVMSLQEKETPWWESVATFFGSLVSGFGELINLLTFTGIPGMPDFMANILRIIFVPMWVILVIGIAPVVADFIRAIGNLIPFT